MYPTPTRSWQVLLIGGASGAGKTSVSYRLAQKFKVGITEIDDLHIAVARLTTPEQQPELHFWRLHPDPGKLSSDQALRHMIEVCRVMTPAVESVIANHLESRVPVVLEGDFIHPALCSQQSFCGQRNNRQVRMLIIDEDDEEQLLSNFAQREASLQPQRAHVSWLYGRWLKREAEASRALVIAARPWETLFERVLRALG